MQKIDIIPLPILPLDKSKIAMTVDILRCLGDHLGLIDVVRDIIVSIKEDLIAVRHIAYAIYQRQDEKYLLYRFS